MYNIIIKLAIKSYEDYLNWTRRTTIIMCMQAGILV